MNFNEQYDKLPLQAQGVIRRYLIAPTESNRSYVVGYVDSLEDCGVISSEDNSFWRRETVEMMVDIHYMDKYVEEIHE